MSESPRIRRLRSDRRALEELRADSTIVDFVVRDDRSEQYTLYFSGKGFWRTNGSDEVLVRNRHEVKIELGAGYPRSLPGMSWVTPVFHPNISAGGVVCLGGYGTHWVPSLSLSELCEMLWDMIRYWNYDVESPYNREAALWAKSQRDYVLPIDPRPIRDRVAGMADLDGMPGVGRCPNVRRADTGLNDWLSDESEIVIVDAEVVDAEVLDNDMGDEDILFLD